jgi:hypothetical protein
MYRFVLCILILGLFSVPCVAQVQPGSTGGSIGKTEKSISGGEEPADSQRAVPARKQPRSGSQGRVEEKMSKQNDGAGSACGRIPGVWTANGWYNSIYGRGDVVLKADGSARHVSGIIGTWTCRRGHFVMDWKNWAHGEGALSSEGNTITFTEGNTMTRGK